MESTGNLWLRIYESLEDHNVSLANPLKTKAISESRIKHDRLDASVLAELAMADLVSECYVPDRNTRDVRDLVQHRIELVKDRTRHKNRIHSILDKYWLRYDGVLFDCIKETFGVSVALVRGFVNIPSYLLGCVFLPVECTRTASEVVRNPDVSGICLETRRFFEESCAQLSGSYQISTKIRYFVVLLLCLPMNKVVWQS
jgi:hypothetical protein